MPENTRRVGIDGGIKVKGVKFQIGSDLARQLVAVVRDASTIAFYLVATGELIVEHPCQAKGSPTSATVGPARTTPSPKS